MLGRRAFLGIAVVGFRWPRRPSLHFVTSAFECPLRSVSSVARELRATHTVEKPRTAAT